MIGKKFGMLTVINDSDERTNDRGMIWICKCDCGNMTKSTSKALNRESRPRSCGCSKSIYSKKIFESNYKKTEGCWNWEGVIGSRGYGKIGAKDTAHRRSYLYHYGSIPKGMMVCHTCDNRLCVNPEHLFLGTAKDNMQDMTNKGRRSRGSKVGTSKMNEKLVLEIRKMRLSGKEYEELANHFGLCWGTIGTICRNEQWRHVPLGEECKSMKQIRKPAIGSKCGSAKLNEEKVREIKKLLQKGMKGREIAKIYNVNFSTISNIKQKRIWLHVI